jgi:hypothetical protein
LIISLINSLPISCNAILIGTPFTSFSKTSPVDICFRSAFVILEGDYKERYRDIGEDGIINIEEKDLFFSISQYQNKWFKKA